MKQFTVETTGVTATMRAMKVSDVDTLLNAKRNKITKTILKMLDDCTVEVHDVKYPIEIKDFSWARTYEGDWFHALLILRFNSLSDEYNFQINCPNCGTKIPYVFGLEDFKIKPANDMVLQTMKEGKTSFEIDTPEFGKLKLRMATGKQSIANDASDSLRGRKSKNGNRAISEVINFRVMALDDSEGPELAEWKKNLSALDGFLLINILDEYNFGVDFTVEDECEFCDNDIEFEIPIRSNFFMPKMKKRKKK